MDTSYDVIKVNKFGQKMRRTIKLTQHHVISIKNGSEITKFYAFSDIRVIWLENQDTVNIQQRSNKMNVYMSPIAPHILQQVTTRVKVRAALDKAEVGALCLAASPYTPPTYIHTYIHCCAAWLLSDQRFSAGVAGLQSRRHLGHHQVHIRGQRQRSRAGTHMRAYIHTYIHTST